MGKARARKINMSRPLHRVPPQKVKPLTPDAKVDLAAARQALKLAAATEGAAKDAPDTRKAKMAVAQVNARYAQAEWAERNPNYAGRSHTPINVKPGMGPVQ